MEKKYFQKRDTRTFSSTEEAVQEQISTASELEREREEKENKGKCQPHYILKKSFELIENPCLNPIFIDGL
jgi:hypothetical protein